MTLALYKQTHVLMSVSCWNPQGEMFSHWSQLALIQRRCKLGDFMIYENRLTHICDKRKCINTGRLTTVGSYWSQPWKSSEAIRENQNCSLKIMPIYMYKAPKNYINWYCVKEGISCKGVSKQLMTETTLYSSNVCGFVACLFCRGGFVACRFCSIYVLSWRFWRSMFCRRRFCMDTAYNANGHAHVLTMLTDVLRLTETAKCSCIISGLMQHLAFKLCEQVHNRV